MREKKVRQPDAWWRAVELLAEALGTPESEIARTGIQAYVCYCGTTNAPLAGSGAERGGSGIRRVRGTGSPRDDYAAERLDVDAPLAGGTQLQREREERHDFARLQWRGRDHDRLLVAIAGRF
jgi:hypothetical protein